MKLKHLLFSGLLLFAMSSCSIFQKVRAPKYDNSAAVMTQNLFTQFQNFYSDLYKATDKTYATNKSAYDAPNANIRTLAVYDSARKHSATLMVIVHDAENRFHTYQAEHESAGKLNNAQITAYRNGMDGLMDVLVRAENHYKK